MLLITRRSGEAIVINGTIEVKVLEVKSGRVKLGFEYPPGSSVFRQELFAKIQDENKAAARAGEVGKTTDPVILENVVRNLHSLGKGAGNPADVQPLTKDTGHDTRDNKPKPNDR